MPPPLFRVNMNGSPIDSYIFLPSPATIHYSMAFEEQETRAAAGLTFDEYMRLPGIPLWIDPDNPVWSKSHYIIWFRMSRRIPAAQSDAQARESIRKSRSRHR